MSLPKKEGGLDIYSWWELSMQKSRDEIASTPAESRNDRGDAKKERGTPN